MNETKGMKPLDEGRLRRLLEAQRWGCLGTLEGGRPLVSWVAYVATAEGSLLLHLSRLAKHTRNLLSDSSTVLAISEPDDGRSDPQTLARITLACVVEEVVRGSVSYEGERDAYLARLPEAAMRFDFEDFLLFRLIPESGHYVEGFGSTHRLSTQRLQQLLVAS